MCKERSLLSLINEFCHCLSRSIGACCLQALTTEAVPLKVEERLGPALQGDPYFSPGQVCSGTPDLRLPWHLCLLLRAVHHAACIHVLQGIASMQTRSLLGRVYDVWHCLSRHGACFYQSLHSSSRAAGRALRQRCERGPSSTARSAQGLLNVTLLMPASCRKLCNMQPSQMPCRACHFASMQPAVTLR